MTMYIQNSRDITKLKGCSTLQNCIGLISLKPAQSTTLQILTVKHPPTQSALADRFL